MANLKFTKTHEWLKPTEAEDWMMGITEHAQKLLGDMVFIELPDLGRSVHKGEEMGVVESVKAASDFYSPVAGVITEINQAVLDNPALVNQDPEGEGWLIKIKPNDRQTGDNLLDADEYQREIREEN